MKIKSIVIQIILTAILINLSSLPSNAVRIKDIATFQTESDLQLFGYGLVIGLDGTGDSKSTRFTNQSLANMMERLGVTVSPDDIKVKNVAAVMVTARLPHYSRSGSKVDCTVSSLGDAASLQGGMLVVTPLSASDGIVYGTAQGPVSIGGFNVQSGGGDRVSENYALVGQVPNGAIIERGLQESGSSEGTIGPESVTASLTNSDFTTSQRIADKINALIESGAAIAVDQSNINIKIPPAYSRPGGLVDFISTLENIEVTPDAAARVVINEKTGTIVAGEHVTISAVALAHGSLRIEINATPQVSQPEPFSGGNTVVTRDSEISATADTASIVYIPEQVDIGDLAVALNRMGVTPRDIIAIFQALKTAGALRAELVIM